MTMHSNRTPQTAWQLTSHLAKVYFAFFIATTFSGCTSILSPVSGVPSHRLPPQFLAAPKNNLIPIDIARLRQEPPREYLIDSRDILGIYVEGVLGQEDQPPPFHIPDSNSDLPPALGFPIPVRDDGTLSLPLVPPLQVRGLTVGQIENVIRRAYTVDQQIIPPGKERTIVTLMRPREYSIVVMRRDGAATGAGVEAAFQRTNGTVVKLPAYENDVLNALAKTGGLPGAEAKNELLILKGRLADARKRDEFVKRFYSCGPGECLCHPPLPDDPSIVRIPLRLAPGAVPTFKPDDIILETGDIVLLEGREREVFYTGGLLGGGEHPLPRDYDLDVIAAMAISGGSRIYGGGSGSGGGGGGGGSGGGGGIGIGSIGGVPPGRLFIIRKTPCEDQIVIAVDLNRAINDPNARPLVQAGDTLILQYKPAEEIFNFGLGTFFTYGVANLLRGNNR
jgi:uncharacterized membrane protein YgcG